MARCKVEEIGSRERAGVLAILERSRKQRELAALMALRLACRMCAAADLDPLEVLRGQPRPPRPAA